MHHATPLITTIVGGLVLSPYPRHAGPINYVFLPGISVSGCWQTISPGFVADTAFAPELAELGVILLMFGVGLHFLRSRI